jgi:hypothetical protein
VLGGAPNNSLIVATETAFFPADLPAARLHCFLAIHLPHPFAGDRLFGRPQQ